ncbi:hypothetical protein RND71_002452 [Anisodus tanguticus]|uniref:Uncharacterized protein n=1 Tax=Anisodus tanguticus TaxID=243964 RepID=A0AAE1VZ25_9SOLA|nr:hypothetical protein RND71_002452 [Anisodus tanguticus]
MDTRRCACKPSDLLTTYIFTNRRKGRRFTNNFLSDRQKKVTNTPWGERVISVQLELRCSCKRSSLHIADPSSKNKTFLVREVDIRENEHYFEARAKVDIHFRMQY